MHALFAVYVCDSTDKLCKDLLGLLDRERAFVAEVVVQFVALTVFQHQPYLVLGDYNFIEAGDVRVYELAMMVDFSSEVRIVFAGGLENDLGAIGKIVSCQVDFSERAFSNELSDRVVADAVQVLRRELAAGKSVSGAGDVKERTAYARSSE